MATTNAGAVLCRTSAPLTERGPYIIPNVSSRLANDLDHPFSEVGNTAYETGTIGRLHGAVLGLPSSDLKGVVFRDGCFRIG